MPVTTGKIISFSLSNVQVQRFRGSMLTQEAFEIKIRHRKFFTADITIARIIRQNTALLSQQDLAPSDILGIFAFKVEIIEFCTKDRETDYIINPADKEKSSLSLNKREIFEGSFVDDGRSTPAWNEVKGFSPMIVK